MRRKCESKKDINQLYKIANVISEDLRYHISNQISVINNIFRPTSSSYYNLIKEAKKHKDLVVDLPQSDLFLKQI